MITITELKARHQAHRPNSICFDESNLRAFGESLATMRVLRNTVTVLDRYGFEHTCYVVSSRRWKETTVHYYFDTNTYQVINPRRW